MVPGASKVIKIMTKSDFVESRSFGKPNRPDSSIIREQEHDVSGVDYYRDQLPQKGILEQATTLILATKRASSLLIKSRAGRSVLAGVLDENLIHFAAL